MGGDGPGSAAYNMREMTGRGATMLLKQYTGKFARGSRHASAKVYISKHHTADAHGADSPAPGAYEVARSSEASSKFARCGGAAWGKAKRPDAATVRF